MAASIALLYPGGQGKHDDEGATSAETAEVSLRRLQVARQIGGTLRNFCNRCPTHDRGQRC